MTRLSGASDYQAGNETGVSELMALLARTPVVADVHPLLPLALPPDIEIVTDGVALLEQLDDAAVSLPERRLLILDAPAALRGRFPSMREVEPPAEAEIDRHLADRAGYARQHLLTNRGVAARIEADIVATATAGGEEPDVVCALLVDGLSWADVTSWPWHRLEPCFVDGPSVTFRFLREEPRHLNPEVGFAAVVGRPSISERLYRRGYHHARGYTYWNPGSNAIADHLFAGIAFYRAANFDGVLARLRHDPPPPHTYVQIVREGLDGLAHGKRELQPVEVEAARDAIHQDIERLANELATGGRRVHLYVTADHGVLWKAERAWSEGPARLGGHSRYCESRAPVEWRPFMLDVQCGGEWFGLARLPYLCGTIPADDSGAHGGVSGRESIVPFGVVRR